MRQKGRKKPLIAGNLGLLLQNNKSDHVLLSLPRTEYYWFHVIDRDIGGVWRSDVADGGKSRRMERGLFSLIVNEQIIKRPSICTSLTRY